MSRPEKLALIRFAQEMRRCLRSHVPIADDDPVWNMTSHLMTSELLGLKVTPTAVIKTSGIPYTTSRRLLKRLIDDGHVICAPRTHTGKTFWVRLSPRTFTEFESYAAAVALLVSRLDARRHRKATSILGATMTDSRAEPSGD